MREPLHLQKYSWNHPDAQSAAGVRAGEIRPCLGHMLSLLLGMTLLFWGVCAEADTAEAEIAVEVFSDQDVATFLPAPPFDVFEAMPGQAVQLLGMRLTHGAAPLLADAQPWSLEPVQPLFLQLYFKVHQPIQDTLSVLLQFATMDGVVSRGIETEIGPGSDARWEMGAVYIHEEIIHLGLIAGRFSGDAHMRVYVGSEAAPEEQQRFQQRLEMKLKPLVGERRVATSRYPEFFGAHYHSLNVGFRLGRGVRQRLALDEFAGDALRAIGLVSSYGYHAAPQGEVIGRCILLLSGEPVHEIPLISGENTARTDYDFDPASQEHQRIAIIESEEADYLDVNGAPFQRHKYAASLDIPEGIVFDTLEFEMLSRGTLDIHDVVLQPESTQ